MKKLEFKNAKHITNEMFENLRPVSVFYKENEGCEYVPNKKYENQHILFRKEFNCTDPTNTKILITADDYYKLYINGKFVTQGPAPSYNFAYYYNSIDISEFLHEGSNTIAVHTYYQGLINRVWVSGDQRHMLICEIQREGEALLSTDETWKTAIHSAYYSCGDLAGYKTSFVEGYDASAKEVDFENVDFDDSKWKNAVVKNFSYYRLIPQPTEQLQVYKQKPTLISKKDGVYIYDTMQEVIGYVTFTASGKKGKKIIIKSGEELKSNGKVRYKLRCNCTYKEEFKLVEKSVRYKQYDYKAFRYLQIEVPKNCYFDEDSFEIVVRHYPFEEKIACPVADENVEAIWSLCSNTIKYGVQEILMDCPTREKGQYLGDATISAIAQSILTQDATFMKKVLMDFARTSFVSTGLLAVSSCSFMQELADYSLQFPLQILWVYNFTKDKEFLKQMQPYARQLCEYFEYYEREDGMLHNIFDKWNMVDWPMNLRDDYDFPLTRPITAGCISVINAFYVGAVTALEQINDELGIEHEKKADKLKESFVKNFFDEETGLFVDSDVSKHSSLHANVLPLLFSIKPDANAAMIKHIDSKGLSRCGVYMAMFFLVALRNAGENELMLKHLKSDGAWNKMLSQGATTCFEAWGKEDKNNTSLFHPWATAPIIALTDTKFPF
ncbi:MAG: family 78 glycoside hydrolase catalytic domain [Clostridia bacterium]